MSFTLDMTRLQFETKLLQRWTFLHDLRPSSANLNALNYGNPEYPDLPSRFSCLDHDPEQIPLAIRYVTIDGDRAQWLSPLWGQVPCSSDGVVPVASAKLFKSPTPSQGIQNVRTSCLPDPIGTNDCGSAHVSVLGSTDYKRSYCVSKNVITVLGGGDIEPICATAPFAAEAVAPDTALQMLGDLDHALAPGASAVDSFQVAGGDYLGVRVRWGRGGVRISLRSPSGAIVDSAATVDNPARLYVSSYGSLFARLDVASAEGGWWRLTTTLTSDSTQMISVRPYVSGGVALDVGLHPARPAVGQLVTVSGSPLAQGAPVLGATVNVEVRDPLGNPTTLGLHDDGLAPDMTAGDGVYSGTFAGASTAGRFEVTAQASGGSAPPYAPRTSRASFQATASPSIVLASGDLTHGSLWGYPSDPIAVAISVHNLAGVPADSVWVSARDDSSGVAFLDTVVAIPANSAVTVQSRFVSTRVGLHLLSFAATALGDVPDVVTGTPVRRFAEVVPFGGSPVVVSVDSLPPSPGPATNLPSRAMPNPTSGPTVLTFYLPHSVPRLRLTVLDVSGRQVSRSEYGGFPAGLQRIVWNSADGAAGRLSAGVYFYRIEAATVVGQGRFVIVR